MLPLVLMHQDQRGRREAKGLPLHHLLRYEPNSQMTASAFKETLQGHLCLWGNAYARIQFNRGGEVKALLPLLPDRTWPERQAGKLVYMTEGHERYAAEEILHVPGLGFNGVVGYSPVAYTREAIAMGLAAQMFGATFFGNGAHLGGVLTHPGHLTPEALRNLRESFEAKFRGPANSSRPAILEEGMKWEPIGIPPDDAQFLETRKFQVLEIARIFRVPPHMLADLERATFSNIEQQGMDFVTYSLQPWLEKWEQEVKRKLLAGTDLVARFDLRMILRGDTAQRFQAYATGRQWGWLSANDIRENEDENLLAPDVGDVYLNPMNMSPMTMKEPAAPAKVQPAQPTGGAARERHHAAAEVAMAVITPLIERDSVRLERCLGKPGAVEAWAAKCTLERENEWAAAYGVAGLGARSMGARARSESECLAAGRAAARRAAEEGCDALRDGDAEMPTKWRHGARGLVDTFLGDDNGTG